jgi:hypothetical protein
MSEIYCNIEECFFNQRLLEPHQKPGRPGFTPLPGTGQFKGKCILPGIQLQYSSFRSSTNQVMRLSRCSSYSLEAVETSPAVTTTCSYRECFFNTVAKVGMDGICRKIEEDEKLYVDRVVVFDGNEKIEIPRCEVASNRKISGHMDWAKAAAGNRGGNMKTMPTAKDLQFREQIRGSW